MILQNISSVISTIHNVDFGQATNRTLSTWVDLSHDLQCLADCQILVGRNDTKDDGTWLRDIPQRHIFGDFVDVIGLFSDGNGGDAGQVDDGQVGTRLGEDIQDDGLVDNLLALAADLVSDEVDACSHLVEVGKLLLRALLQDLVELGIRSG